LTLRELQWMVDGRAKFWMGDGDKVQPFDEATRAAAVGPPAPNKANDSPEVVAAWQAARDRWYGKQE
jgi:hypothetical protein